jgi:hypothetical protein
MESDWEKILPVALRHAAYRAGTECAWSRTEALQVIELLVEKGYSVIGVDIWLPTNPGPTIPTPFVYDWDLESVRASKNYPGTALEFVRTFEWDSTDLVFQKFEPYFNILPIRPDA